jgi:hypothetical protein
MVSAKRREWLGLRGWDWRAWLTVAMFSFLSGTIQRWYPRREQSGWDDTAAKRKEWFAARGRDAMEVEGVVDNRDDFVFERDNVSEVSRLRLRARESVM